MLGCSQIFFKCLSGDSSEQAEWYSQIKSKMTREIFQRQMLGAEKQDHSANEIYPEHVEAIALALARHNTQESARRESSPRRSSQPP